jgi:hypothetical protein
MRDKMITKKETDNHKILIVYYKRYFDFNFQSYSNKVGFG